MKKQNTARGVAQEITFLSEGRQKELYEIVRSAFEEDLKTRNCFILPEVGKRVGEELAKKGFGKANKQTFLGAPNHFAVGYNEKNAASISLLGFSPDPNFSLTINNRESSAEKREPTPATDTTEFSEKRQEELAKLIESAYAKHLQQRNCILILDIAKRLDGVLIKRNFGKASRHTFARAPKYFACGYNEKNSASIMLLNHPADPSFTIERKETVATFSKTANTFADRLHASLKKQYKTIDVSETVIQRHLTQNKMVLPQEIESFDKLFTILSEKYGCITRSNGENTPEERYIILRKTLPIPQETIDVVKRIVAQYFSDKDIVSNTDIGQALKNNGVDFKDYNYPDLTGFLRSFTELFSIVPITDPKTKKVQINVRILKTGLDQCETNKYSLFKDKLQQVLGEGRLEYAMEPVVLRTALEINDAEVWEAIIGAVARIEASRFAPIETITEWEKLVITMNSRIRATLNDSEFLMQNGVDGDLHHAALNFLKNNTSKTSNFSTLGLRVSTMCGEKNNLALYFYLMGLIAGDSSDKNYCFRNYAVFCARHYPECFRKEWDQNKDIYVDNRVMLYIVSQLFDGKCYDLLVYAYENMPVKVSQTDQVDVFYKYAKAILEPVLSTELPALNSLEETRSIDVLASYLNTLEQRNDLSEYCEMLSLCLSKPDRYIRKSIMDGYFSVHSDFVSKNFGTLVELAKSGDYKYWLIANYFTTNGYVQDEQNAWRNFTQEYKILLRKRINETTSDEEKQAMLRKSMHISPMTIHSAKSPMKLSGQIFLRLLPIKSKEYVPIYSLQATTQYLSAFLKIM